MSHRDQRCCYTVPSTHRVICSFAPGVLHQSSVSVTYALDTPNMRAGTKCTTFRIIMAVQRVGAAAGMQQTYHVSGPWSVRLPVTEVEVTSA